MVAIRLPGAESIERVGVARDNGVRATPDEFGSGIGQAQEQLSQQQVAEGHALSKLGETAVHVGALLDRRREAAAMAGAVPETEAQFKLDAVQRHTEGLKTTPTDAQTYGANLDTDLQKRQQELIAAAQAKYNLSDFDAAKLNGHLTTIRGGVVVKGVTDANKALVDGQVNSAFDTAKTIASTSMATGDIDGGLKQLEDTSAALKGVAGEATAREYLDKSRNMLVDSVIGGLNTRANDPNVTPEDRAAAADQAQALRNKYYGTTPQPAMALRGRALPPAVSGVIDQAAARAGIPPELARTVAGIESSGNPHAQTGSYKGLFQLSQEEFDKHGGGNIFNPADNARAGAAVLRERIDNFRAKFGREPTPTEIYLAHQQGDQGLAAHLANPNAPAWRSMYSTAEGQQKGEAWAKRAIWGNIPDDVKRQFPGGVDSVTSRDFVGLWQQKVEGKGDFALYGKPLYPNPEKALFWDQQLTSAKTRAVSQASTARSEALNLQLVNAASGQGPLPPRSAIQDDPFIGDDNRASLLAHYDRVAGDVEGLQAALQKFSNPNGGPFNPYDKEEKQRLNQIYDALGGGPAALQQVFDRAGQVPTTAGVGIRGALVSTDPKLVAQALTVASNVIYRNGNAFAGIPGEKDITDAAKGFVHDIKYGTTPEAAAAKYIREQSPEYQAQLKQRIKTEDIDARLKDEAKKGVLESELRSAFGDWWQVGALRPSVEVDPKTRQSAMADYAEKITEHFNETGDVKKAKEFAIEDVQKRYGVTHVNGSTKGIFMFMPVERAAAYERIPNAAALIADQAIQKIKDGTGKDVTRDKLIISPLTGENSRDGLATVRAYGTGRPVPYMLMWTDDKGHRQMLQPGDAFTPNPDAMWKVVREERERIANTAAMRPEEPKPVGQMTEEERRAAREANWPGGQRTLTGATFGVGVTDTENPAEEAAKLRGAVANTLRKGVSIEAPGAGKRAPENEAKLAARKRIQAERDKAGVNIAGPLGGSNEQ